MYYHSQRRATHLKTKTEEPCLDIGDGENESPANRDLIRGILGGTVDLETVLQVRLLLLVEPFDVGRGVGHPEHEDEAETDRPAL